MTTPATSTRDERINRLRSQLSPEKTRTDSKATARLKASKPQNLLFGAALHAVARLAEGLPLSELEETLVNGFWILTDGDDGEIAEYGNIFIDGKKSRDACGTVFPDAILRMDTSTPYDTEHQWRTCRSEETAAAIAQAGSGVIVFRGPNAETRNILSKSISATPNLIKSKLVLDRFKCLRSSGDTILHNDDAIYWCTAAGSEFSKNEHRGDEYGSISTGSTRDFSSGKQGMPVLSRGLYKGISWGILNVGRIAGVLFNVSKYSMDAATSAAGADDWGDRDGYVGTGAAILALVGLISGLVGELIRLVSNDDDFVGRREVTFTKSALQELFACLNKEVSMVFDGDHGKQQLWIKELECEPATGAQIQYTLHNGTSWSAVKHPSS
ncbi:MAG: hypothetical protein Q9225_006510 [Loekoesia sp. 1 TL-2023]